VALPVTRRPSRSWLLFVLSAGLGGQACGGDGTGPAEVIVDLVLVTPPAVTVEIGGTAPLQATVLDAAGRNTGLPVEWSSSATGVATVSATGLVTGVGPGTATVAAEAGGVTGTSEVTVLDPDPPAAPSAVRAVPVSHAEVDVTWTDNSSAETHFVIEREQQGAADPPAASAAAGGATSSAWIEAGTVDADVTTFRDGELDPGTSYRYRVAACNDNGCSSPAGGAGEDGTTSTYPVLLVETEELPGAFVGVPYARDLVAVGGDGTFAWSLADGALPPGLDLSAAGKLAGTPAEAGMFGFTVGVAGGGQEATVTLSVAVVEVGPLSVETENLPDGLVGSAYLTTLEAAGGVGGYAWSLAGGELPAGVSLSEEGALAGVPLSPGAWDFTVAVASGDAEATADLSLRVLELLEITTTALATGVEGRPYAVAVEAAGGDGIYTWSLVAGELPEGLSLDPSGLAHGTPGVLGGFDFTVGVTSGDGQDATAELSIEILPALMILTGALPDGVLGEAYAAQLAAAGGDGVHTWSLVDGALPQGLALDGEAGAITGVPAAAGAFAPTFQVASGDGQMAAAEIPLTIASIPVTIDPVILGEGAPGTPYAATQLGAAGGDGQSYAWSVASGALPVGLSLSPGGVLSGTPSGTGAFTITVRVESGGHAATVRASLNVVGTLGGVGLDLVASGLDGPLFLTSPPGDDRLFVVEKVGRIRVLEDGALLPTPYVDLTGVVRSEGERGLLGLAFHPDFQTNGLLYVHFTNLSGDSRVASLTASDPADATVDPETLSDILTVPQPGASHKGGQVSFGPDGLLYLSFGDGGGQGDPGLNGQDVGNLLSSVSRIDVDGGDPYAIPPGNPFSGEPGARDELWAIGLRNPWRFSHDEPSGLLFIADVGQDEWEEVNVAPAGTGGQNWGWSEAEGFGCYREAGCALNDFDEPLLAYSHAVGCSIIGGYVYRGSTLSGLVGRYVFSDFCEGWIRALRVSDGAVVELVELSPEVGSPTSFGVDSSGEIYVTDVGGRLWKLVPG
jgi:hypothetical protein